MTENRINENLSGDNKLKLTLCYDGTAFCGWQVQKDKPTVQKAVQEAIFGLCGKVLPVTGCSRTDSGVHANEFVCHTDFIPIDCEKLPIALNTHLPPTVAIKKAEIMPTDFHARYSCTGKEYLYKIFNSPLRDPFLHTRAMLYPRRLDEKALDAIASAFCGKHDFRSFMAQGSKIVDTVRNVFYCNVLREDDMVMIKVAADGFLYNMVRIICGTLIHASEKGLSKDDVAQIIDSCDRKNAGATAPACGLYLNKVFYN